MNTYSVTSTAFCVVGRTKTQRLCPCNSILWLPATERMANLLQGYRVVQRKARVAGLDQNRICLIQVAKAAESRQLPQVIATRMNQLFSLCLWYFVQVSRPWKTNSNEPLSQLLILRKRKDREFRGTVPSRLHTMEGDNFPNQKQATIAKAAKWILNSQKSNMTTTAGPLNILQSGLEDVTYVHEELNK